MVLDELNVILLLRVIIHIYFILNVKYIDDQILMSSETCKIVPDKN